MLVSFNTKYQVPESSVPKHNSSKIHIDSDLILYNVTVVPSVVDQDAVAGGHCQWRQRQFSLRLYISLILL